MSEQNGSHSDANGSGSGPAVGFVNGGGLAADYERCAEITRKSSSNFYYAFLLLPAERRRALHAVYAFCRYLDDIADDDVSADPAKLLGLWRAELARVYEGEPTRAISRALADSIRTFKIPRVHFEELINGIEMDLSQKRYATFVDLYPYCHRVASVVGLISIEIFGYRNPDAKVYAENLGIACQLTNILRDVSEDAARGRIYIPLEDLERFQVTEKEILAGIYSANFARLMAFEANRAREYYERAQRALPREDRATLLTAEAMRLIYGTLLERIVRSEYRVLDRRLSIPAVRKLYLVGRAWASGRLGALWG
jgi:phytoene synthase